MRNRIFSRMCFTLLAVIIAAAFTVPVQPVAAERAGTFAGTWIASGQRQTFDFVEDRVVGTFRFTGHVNLRGNLGEIEDYWAECVGLSDSVSGGSVRCVWRSMEGDKAYIVLTGQPLEQRNKVTGEFVGGTGSLRGIKGTFTFTWSSVFTNESQGIFTGQTNDLKGSYRIP